MIFSQSLPSCCRFSAAFNPRTFHVAREMVKLSLSCSVRELKVKKVDIIKGAIHGSKMAAEVVPCHMVHHGNIYVFT